MDKSIVISSIVGITLGLLWGYLSNKDLSKIKNKYLRNTLQTIEFLFQIVYYLVSTIICLLLVITCGLTSIKAPGVFSKRINKRKYK